MTQTRPRLDDDLAADVKAYAEEWHISFNAAVTILIRTGLRRGLRPDDEMAVALAEYRARRTAGQEQEQGSTT